jgi:hypothetical protein
MRTSFRVHAAGAFAGLIMAGCLMMAVGVGADSGTIVEESTGTKFDEMTRSDGRAYRCLGVGVRKLAFVTVYALAFCVDAAHADTAVSDYVKKHHAGLRGKPLAEALQKDSRFFETLAQTKHSRLVILKMQRNVSQNQLRSTLRRSLSPLVPEAKLDELDAAITKGAKKGQVVTISAAGPKLTVNVAGEVNVVDDADVARNLFLVWLGTDSVSPSLRNDIARRAAGDTRGT